MRTPSRTVSIFTLSALDVLAMATGVFVLLVVMMMPYYRMTFDAGAEMEGIRVSVSELHAEIEADRRAAAGDAEAAGEIEAAAAAAEDEATRKREAASRLRAQAAAQPPPPTVSPQPRTGDIQVVDALDLVFVIDASGSMGPVLTELSQSVGGIARVLEKLIPSLRVGIVAYRDYDVGGWVVSDLPLTPTRTNLAAAVAFAAGLRPATVGGATVTEAVYAGLERAVGMPFRPGAKHLIIVIGDASPHANEQGPALALARAFAAGGPRRAVSTLFVTTPAYLRFGSGDREFFARLAEAGGGTFSDHRGELLEGVLLSVLEE
jgi:hypothetical protein